MSGVGTTSYSRCAHGYEYNFKGIVAALEDLNTTTSGIIAGGGGGDGKGNCNLTIGGSGIVDPDSDVNNLWFDENQGRLFVWAEDNWYQCNAEALALMSDTPPAPSGLQAPPRDGSLWFNTAVGNFFVYDEASAAWYEGSSTRLLQFGPDEPVGLVVGETWGDTSTNTLRVWNGSTWQAL